VWEKLTALKETGLTVLLTTHYMEEAARLCDRLVIVDHGAILVEGSPGQLVAAHAGSDIIEIQGPDQALRDFLKAKDIPHDDLGKRIILYASEGTENFTSIREQFCTEKCTYRNATLEDVFLRLTGRELRE
jgi:lipooligosaccharide transport system ATP-binding protein